MGVLTNLLLGNMPSFPTFLLLVSVLVVQVLAQGRLPANKACRGKAVGASCIKRCCTIKPTGNCCARSKASSTCTIKDGRIKCLFPDHNLFGAPPVHASAQPPVRRQGAGAGLPANRACKTKQVGDSCIKKCCTVNPSGNCCARSRPSSRCTVKDGRIRCLV